MSFLEVIPPSLLQADKLDNVVLLLQALPIPQANKKEILVEWCNYVGAALTKDMVDRVLNPLIGGYER
jgi:hypothetical protein